MPIPVSPARRTLTCCLLVGLAFSTCARPARAALEWSGTAVHREVEAATERTMLEFPFRNAGAGTVRIVAVRADCDCLEARADRETYAPGADGRVRVDFKLLGRSGRQERTVVVETEEPERRSATLLVVVEIAEPVAFEPRVLRWTQDEAPAAKPIAVKFSTAPGTPAVVESVTSGSAGFNVRFQPAPSGAIPGGTLWVEPVATDSPAQTTIRLTVRFGERTVVALAQAAVR